MATRTFTKPSIPPASPRHAGHYSGLHPEDQPYQSSKMSAQRPPAQDAEQWLPPQREPGPISLHSTATPPDLAIDPEVTLPATYNQRPLQPSFPPYMPRKQFLPPRTIPIILTVSCILFLLASGILAFALMGKQSSVATAVVRATPDTGLRPNDTFTLSGQGFGPQSLMTFSYDINQPIFAENGKPLEAHADSQGNFSLQIRVLANWGPGQHVIHATDEAQKLSVSTNITVQAPSSAAPNLQLSAPGINFEPAAPGVVTNKTITLVNKGGGQISWQASSDQPWLSATPNSGTFSGSTDVQVTVNRGSLAPQTYTGHITFTQQGASVSSLTFTVTMVVNSAPAALNISTTALTYSGSTAQNPNSQTFLIQNSGGQALDWASNVTTGDGSSWLSISPTSGHLEQNSSTLITVSVQTQQLAVGSYQGAITFTGGANAQVKVSCTVVAPGNMVVSPPSLSLAAATGQQDSSKTITLQNSGDLPLTWTSSATTASGKWLSATPASGTLDQGAQANVTIHADATGLIPGAYQGTLTISAEGLTKQVAVSLTVTSPPAPTISVSNKSLSFTALNGKNPDAQTLTVTNTGNATLNWVTTEDGNGASFVSVTPTQGSLAPAQSINLTISVTNASPGQSRAVITIADKNAGSTGPVQKIPVTITIQGQAAISVSPATLTFNNNSTSTNTAQSLTINNAGSADLNWTIAQPSGSTVSWLSVDTANGTLSPGKSATVNINCNSQQLSPGTYTATLIISDSDTGTSVASQTVSITLVVT